MYRLSEAFGNITSFATENIKDIFKIEIEPRHDSFTDQYHGILMKKLLLVILFVMGINWCHDSVNCLDEDMSILRGFFIKFSEYALRNWLHPKDVHIKSIKYIPIFKQQFKLKVSWNFCVICLTFEKLVKQMHYRLFWEFSENKGKFLITWQGDFWST